MKLEEQEPVDESIPFYSSERKGNPISKEIREKRLECFEGGAKEGLRVR
jgi:hypothetical protein